MTQINADKRREEKNHENIVRVNYDHQTEIDRTIRQQEDFVAALRQRTPSKLATRRVIAAHG